MTANAIARASAALLFSLAALVPGHALAQNYDGAGLLRFGVFGQAANTEFDIKRPIEARDSESDTAFGGGATFGYDYLFHSGLVLGIESDIGFDTAQIDIGPRDFSTNFMASIRGRVGSYVRPDLLLYGTAGVAFLGVEYDGLVSPATGLQFDDSDTLVGWTAGAGAEFDWHGVILFGEYLFASYDTFSSRETLDDFDPLIPEAVLTTRFRNEADVDQHLFRIGAKFIIGHDYRPTEAYVPLK